MTVIVDATTLIALGRLGRLDLLTAFDGDVRVPDQVVEEVTSEPARTNLESFLDARDARAEPVTESRVDQARNLLGDEVVTGDVRIVAAVLAREGEVGIVSDDRRVRTVTEGLGATVTGTIGVLHRAVEEGPDDEPGLTVEEGKMLVDRLDDAGLHMTASLRENALQLIDEAGSESR